MTATGSARAWTLRTGPIDRFTWLHTGSLPTLLDDGTWRYIQGPTGPIAQVDDEGTVLWLHRDLTGSVRALTDDRAAVAATFTWDAYGEQVAHTGDASTRLGYHGRWTDPGTGLQVLPARVYDPATGQFLSVDPSVIATHHPYAFAAGDPLGATDPSGADPKPVTVLAGHGGWYGSSGFVTVPEGTTVIFHQPAGSPITDPYGLSIEEGAPIKYAEVYGPGSRIPDYTLAKPEDLVTLPSSVTVTQDTQLSSLLKPGMGTVHWAACRTASGSDRSIVNSSLAWRPITTYGQDPASPDADWGGLTATTIWSPADHESNNGHIDAPLWDAQGPVLDPWRNSMPVEFDPAWYDWDSQDILPTS